MDDVFIDIVNKIYDDLKSIDDGEVADYIPQLAKVNPDLFGISVCDIEGKKYSLGDTNIKFCLQSCCKPLLYCVARDLCGKKKVHKHMGYEPSGQRFNAFILDEDNRPHNPMINTGAIMTSSLIMPESEPADRFDCIKKYLHKLSGNNNTGFDNSVFLSERTHASRNRALAYFMEEKDAFPKNTNIQKTLEFYFQNCSILSTCQTMAVIAGTLANGGTCPITNENALDIEIVRDCLSLMYTCGMYDYTGRFSFEIGLPAKSGVSGCIFIVIPNKMGICVWSPRLDKIGNSVKGIEFCKSLVAKYPNFHIFNNLTRKIEFNYKKLDDDTLMTMFITAASNGNLEKINEMSEYVQINNGDYDNRSALHLACANGHLEVVDALLKLGANPDIKDRWGNTPLHETKINMKKNPEIYAKIDEMLKK